MYPVPTTAQLATFSGRAESTYTSWSAQALTQSALLFQLKTGLTESPEEEELAALALNAVLEMGDEVYLNQLYRETRAGPFQSETIGSYSYSLAPQKARNGLPTGLVWWDLAVATFGETTETETGAISVLERDPNLRRETDTGVLAYYGPRDLLPGPDVPFDVNAEEPYRGNQ